MLVRALKDCFAGGARRRKGAVFTFHPHPKQENLPPFLEAVAPGTQATDPDILPAAVPGAAPRAGVLPGGEAASAREPDTLSGLAAAQEADRPTVGGEVSHFVEPSFLE